MIEKRFKKAQTIAKKKKEEVINAIKDFFSNQKNVLFVYLYGSFVEGKFFRDIDVALYLDKPGRGVEIESDLSAELSRITGYAIEVCIINRAPVHFQLSVLKEGLLIFNRSEEIRTDFIESVSRKYLEVSHFRKIALGA